MNDTSTFDSNTSIVARLTGAPLARVAVEGRPVSANRIWRIAKRATKSGKRQMYLTDEAAAWEMAVLADTISQADPRLIAHATNLRIRCTFYGVRGDADNYLKATLDGLKRALKIDDREFREVSSSVYQGKAKGKPPRKAGAEIEIFGDLPEYLQAFEQPAPTEPEPAPAPTLAAATAVGGAWKPPSASDRHDLIAPAARRQHQPGSLNVRDLVDAGIQVRERVRAMQAITGVTVEPATLYGGLFFLVPASAELGTQEWGAFLSWAHARQLRDRLSEALAPIPVIATPSPKTPPALPDAREAVQP